jgi:hypothetical protein
MGIAAGQVRGAPIALVQHASKDAGVTSSSSLAFVSNNTAGNWIAVVIRAGKSGQVLTVGDTRGNTYQRAVQFNQTLDAPNGETLGIFYAENISGGPNTVTVAESISNNTLRFAILEYSGVATSNSLDVTAAAQGTGKTASSGSATTTGGDLVLGEVATANGQTYTAGSGFTIEEKVPAAPNTKLIVEDEMQTSAGALSVTATLSRSDNWGVILATFKAAGGGGTPPSITSLNPTSGPAGTSVTISGAGFGATQGTSTVTFNGTAAAPTNWSATSIVAPVPSGATTGNVTVTVGGLASNGATFTVIPTPSIATLSPSSGSVSSTVLIVGTNFGVIQGASTVTFNGIPATTTGWSATAINAIVPSGATSGNVVVTVGGVPSNGMMFTVTPISVSVTPTTASISTGSGASFNATVQNDVQNKSVTWSLSGAGCAGSACGTVSVTAGPQLANYTAPAIVPTPALVTLTATSVADPTKSGTALITVTQSVPNIASLNPAVGTVGTLVTINGTNFGAAQGASTVTFNGAAATPASWSATSISVQAPAGATTGNVVVTVGGFASNGVNFTVSAAAPVIASLSPSTGGIDTPVTITGTNFGATQGTSTVTFNGTAGAPTFWSATSITVPVPYSAGTGSVVVTVGGAASNAFSFTVQPPNIAGLNPTSGVVGTVVTITGTNFGATQGTSNVVFNGLLGLVDAIPTSWSAMSIVTPVPSGAATGSVFVWAGQASNSVHFTMIPSITNLNPASGMAGTSVTITGVNFGANQGTSTVSFNGTPATPTSWSDTTIVAPAPSGVTTGNVLVIAGGVVSNALNFTVTPPPPNITSLGPTPATIGALVTIGGNNFGATQGTSTLTFNGVLATPLSWSATSIVAPVPSGATTGNVVVTVGGMASNGALFTLQSGVATIKLVQQTSKDAGTTTSSSLSFPTNNTAGNWIAVAIRAGRSAQVFSVKDSNGNSYQQAVQLNVTVDAPNGDTLGIFYAENIAGGPNTVTVSDTISNGSLRFAILEYSGVLAANSLDVSTAAQGSSAAPNSGNATTNASGDLLLGAFATANAASFTAGSGFAVEARVPAAPNSKLMAEDQIQATAGSVSANATLNTSDNWGAVLATFKASGSGGAPPPIITNLSPTAGVVGTPVTITGVNFGATQGTSTVSFNGMTAAPMSWNGSTIVVPVPSGATTGNVVVTVGGVASNGVSFGVGPISVSINPASAIVAAATSQQFSATLQNDPQNLGVAWSLSGSGCSSAACGTLSSMTQTSVTYTAPAAAPTPPNVTIGATSVTDSTKSAAADVTIGPPPPVAVTVSPASRTVSVNLTQQFVASVQYDFNSLGVTWSLSGVGCSGASCGVLSSPTSSGNAFTITYTAPASLPIPATVTITATSVADNTKSAFATVTVSQGVPTSLGWFQIPNTMLQPICPNIPQIQGTIGCQAVISAWSGGIADTSRNRLIFTGGGHLNYWGDEVYSLNLVDLTLTRITDPTFSTPIPTYQEDWGNPPTIPSAPAARETYSGLAYVAHLDKMWLFGGALATTGYQSSGMWMLDLPTLTWTRMDPTLGVRENVYTDINYADYDAQSKLVYFYIADNDVLAAYSADTNTTMELLYQQSPGNGYHSNGVLDPKRHLFFILGGGVAASYDLTTSPPTFRNFNSQTVGCSGVQNMSYPGLAYDPVQDKIVGWAGGDTVYLFDTPTLTCTAVTYPGGPPLQQVNGTFGRWRYFPSLNLFALVNDWAQNAYTLRLTPAP